MINLNDNSNGAEGRSSAPYHDIFLPDTSVADITPGLNETYDTNLFRFHVDTPFFYN